MRKIQRVPLPASTQNKLDAKQHAADHARAAGILDTERAWKAARQTRPLKTALEKLKVMAGERERCMYCGDSHGTDIEHFWPKQPYPGKMYRWPNMLLCCTECGRFKGSQFPLDGGQPLLIDPTTDNPWDHVDFNPDTLGFVPRFDLAIGLPSSKGVKTVEVLQLDRREALEAGYRRTHRRVKAAVENAIQQDAIDTAVLIEKLKEADEHGLIGWYLHGTGQNVPPFSTLRQSHAQVWQACVQSLI